MVSQAEEFAETDKARKNVIEATNSAQSIIHETEKAMTEHKDKIDAAEADKIREMIASLQTLIAAGPDGTTADAVKEGCDGVQQASLKLFQKVYESKAQEGKKDEPVEAEFKDAEKEKDAEKK